ncbi:MAG: 2-oxoglutarate dehydrogenase complex dihydrolipoyllysine-residue succinyltransferase [Pseudomonadota bacterium]
MSIDVKVPQLPESVADATLISWHKKPGDSVQRDENLVDLETDKVVLEVPAPQSGVLKEILIEDGATVTSGEVLAILEEGEVAAAPGPEQKESVQEEASDSQDRLSPSVRRLLEEHSLDAKDLAGTGRDGRISKSDVLDHLAKKDAKPASTPAKASTPQVSSGSREERRVPMTRLRTKVAERLVNAQQTAAMLTTFNEVDLTAVKALRAQYKESFDKAHGVKLGFMSFFVKAASEALKRYPAVNAFIDDNDIVYHDYADIGIAVSTERGLLVPILRDADQMQFADVEKGINDFATRARAGEIALEELTGGTFTITNGGVFGSLISTPILNPPQTAILGMHKIQDRPIAMNGEVVIRPMMYLAISYDHRLIDGKEAVQFLVAIKEYLEDPARLLLQI